MRFSSVLLGAAFLATGIDAFVAPKSPSLSATISRSSITKLGATIEGTTPATTFDPTVAAVPKVAQRWRKSTKQVATLGPASSSVEMIETLFLAGADVFRLNFSHGSQEQKKELLDMIRTVEEKYSHPIAILGDLQGPKLRVRFKISFTCLFFLFFLILTKNYIFYFLPPSGWRIFRPQGRGPEGGTTFPL